MNKMATGNQGSNTERADSANGSSSAATHNNPSTQIKSTSFDKFSKNLAELVSQHPELKKVISGTATEMFGEVREINRRHLSLQKFGDVQGNKDRLDKGESCEPFLPLPLRNLKHPLTSSNKVEKDDRAGDSRTAIKAMLERSELIHAQYRKEMSVLAGEIAEKEVEARINILKSIFITSISQIAVALIKSNGKKLHNLYANKKLSEEHLAMAAIKIALNGLPKTFWDNVPFATFDEMEKFWKEFQTATGINYDKDIKSVYEIEGTHPDAPVVEAAAQELCPITQKITVDFWEYQDKIDKDKELGAELKELFGKKKTDDANMELEEAMDAPPQETMREFIVKEIQAEKNKTISKRKKAARKNSSDGTKNQEPTSNESGGGRSRKSKEKGTNGQNRSNKRSSELSDDDSHNSRQSRNNRNNRDRAHQQSRRSRSRSRQGILRGGTERKFVAFQEGVYPPRYGRRTPSPHYRAYKSQEYFGGRGHQGRGRGRGNYQNHPSRGRGRGDYRGEYRDDWRGGGRNWRNGGY